MSKTILELQEELERVIPSGFLLDIEDYSPSRGGKLTIKERYALDYHKYISIGFDTIPECMEKAIDWFKNYKP